jgi:hypothetical protein
VHRIGYLLVGSSGVDSSVVSNVGWILDFMGTGRRRESPGSETCWISAGEGGRFLGWSA